MGDARPVALRIGPFVSAHNRVGAANGRSHAPQIDSAPRASHIQQMTRSLSVLHRLHRVLAATGFAVAMMVAAAPSRAQDQVPVQGEILDLTCYLSKGSKGERHKTCAKLCAKKGLPLGVLTDDGKVFLLIEDHDDSDPYNSVKDLAGGRAEITGKHYSKDGMESILVSGAKGL
jgi:hypothetical protein